MAGKRDKKGSGRGVIIIRKMGDDAAGGHHGGAWKVAYADFVTAMMAFFLLMWLHKEPYTHLFRFNFDAAFGFEALTHQSGAVCRAFNLSQ
jgi:flagellar motor protein MotB